MCLQTAKDPFLCLCMSNISDGICCGLAGLYFSTNSVHVYPVTSSAAGVKKMCEILYYSAAGDIMPKRSVPVSRLWAVVDTTIASIFFYCFFVALVALLCSCRDSGESEVVQVAGRCV
ncbi:hypothetical protein Tco_0921583 [Tanacetum coccineum]